MNKQLFDLIDTECTGRDLLRALSEAQYDEAYRQKQAVASGDTGTAADALASSQGLDKLLLTLEQVIKRRKDDEAKQAAFELRRAASGQSPC